MSNILNCIKENVYNSKVIGINNILGLIVNDKEIEDGVYRELKDGGVIEKLEMGLIEKLDNILYRCERGAISNDPPATIIGLEAPLVNDIRKYIISSIINIVIKNNNIQDIIKTTRPLIIIRTNLGIQITNLNIVMKVGILNFINAIIVSIVSLIAIINSGAKFIFNSEYEQAIIGVIAAAILTINLVYLGTRLARIFGKK